MAAREEGAEAVASPAATAAAWVAAAKAAQNT